ncbi:coiled-coil domain-containing protein 82-like isoform X2 [Acropora muricata]|uniref:coiled-coil domain-containing protein 82-like isoform X2 n=1 Tax=Acropora muricata TaxID=159855 RepID=UPI0034E43596
MSCISDSVLPIFYKKTKKKRTGKKLLFENTSDDQRSSSEESLTAPSRRSAASLVRKRTLILSSSDDEDEKPHNDMATPSPALQKSNKRRRSSSKTRQRRKKLEEYRANREKSVAKKKKHLNYPLKNPTLTSSSSEEESACPVSKKGSPIKLISSSSKEELTSPDSKKEDSSSLSSEDDLDGSREKDFECTWSSKCMVGPILISSDSEEDLSTPNSKDGSSQDEDDPTLGGFVVPNSDCSSEDVDWRAHISANDLPFVWNPTRKEIFELFLQSLLTRLLLDEDPSYGCLESILKKSQRHVDAVWKVESVLESKKNLVSSSRWDRKFTDELKKNRVLTHEQLPYVFEGKCQACRFSRDISRMISLQNDDGETVVEFLVGRFCAGKATIYQKIHHFCDVKLKKSCKRKIPGLKEVVLADRDRPILDSVIEYCQREEQRQWMNQLFDDYEKLLNKADKWTREGSHYRSMQSTVFSNRD